MKKKQLFLCAALLASICAMTMAAQQTGVSAKKGDARGAGGKQTGKEEEQNLQAEGERIFARRCSSCHNAPEGFSPRISGTVVRHMRVRASLSKREEEALLRFFNP